MYVTLGDKCPSYSTVQHSSMEGEQRSWKPTHVKIPENVDAIHSMILGDR
jgi:hypothetical protein